MTILQARKHCLGSEVALRPRLVLPLPPLSILAAKQEVEGHTLPVAVKPEYQVVAALGFGLEMPTHMCLQAERGHHEVLERLDMR